MRFGGFHFQRLGANSPSVPTLSTTRWLNTEETQMVLKNANESANETPSFQKSLQIKNETNPELFTRE